MSSPVLMLIGVNGPEKEIPINGDKFLIGRGLNNEYVVKDLDISRTHCVLEKKDNEWIISDQSVNGTLINGKLVDKTINHQLIPGDIISISQNIKFVFKLNPLVKSVDTLSDEDILNLADTVLAEVQYVEAEFENEKFEDIVSNNCAKSSYFTSSSEIGNAVTFQPLAATVKTELCLPSKENNMEENIEKESSCPSTKATMPNYMEDELTCSICCEMFVQAITLNCSHTFCKFCLEQWQKNQSCCPICRAKISTKCPTRIVDGFIEKVLESATEEVKDQRQQLLKQRQELIASGLIATTSSASTSSSSLRSNVDTIEISSDDEVSELSCSDFMSECSDWNCDSEEEYNGLPGVYFGGYGHCFTCGQRGHWSNGCPNRRPQNR